MKLNFNQQFVNYMGIPIQGENGEPQLMKNILAALLFGGAWLEKKANVRPEDKVMAADLSTRIYKAVDAIDITVEEASMIKEAATSLNPGGYVQVINLIEGK